MGDDECWTGNPIAGGERECTLRAAIEEANSNDTVLLQILFKIPGAGVHTIRPATAYLTIVDLVAIDGRSQPGGAPGTPMIEINGGGGSYSGLKFGIDDSAPGPFLIDSSGSTVRGLIINNFAGDGIEVGVGRMTIAGNHIGTNPAGTMVVANTANGINFTGFSSNTVGGGGNANRNVISGNLVGFRSGGFGGNTIQGKHIGTDLAGEADLGNGAEGILIDGLSDEMVIGGFRAGQGNVISGNGTSGIDIRTASPEPTLIQGNNIGTNAAGNAAIGNDANGIRLIAGARQVEIGGAGASFGNIISGNGGAGVRIEGIITQKNKICGNRIGTNDLGTAAIPNQANGVLITDGATMNQIGGTIGGQGNIISGNALNGIAIIGAPMVDPSTNFVFANFIGTNAAGTIAIPNTNSGVRIELSSGNLIGSGGGGSARNVISGNARHGIEIIGDADGFPNFIQGNYVGTKADGLTALPNSMDGISLFQSVRVIVGGPFDIVTNITDRGNVISGNTGRGIAITAGSGHAIARNQIGESANGMPLGNGGDGVYITIADGCQVGPANIIQNNGGHGVHIFDPGDPVTTIENAIFRNSIYQNTFLGIDLADNLPTLNDIGDTDFGANELQNFPIITTVDTTGVIGRLETLQNENYTIEVFASDSGDISGFGEGQRFLGSKFVLTDSTGMTPFRLTGLTLDPGDVISATATRDMGFGAALPDPRSTSEFSPWVVVPASAIKDFGDAPDDPPLYPTLAENDGAHHIVTPGLRLGAEIDSEFDGLEDAFALGDDTDQTPDDEDGVVFLTSLEFDFPPNMIEVTASAPGLLDAWIDFNIDGDWNDPGEQIFTQEPLLMGANMLNVVIPEQAADGPTFARFRFGSFPGLTPVGLAPDGEVEDYQVTIRGKNQARPHWRLFK